MTDAISAAVIASGTSFATLVLKSYLTTRQLLPIPPEVRRSIVCGSWTGILDEPSHIWGPLKAEVTFEFKTKRKVVSGTASVKANLKLPDESEPRLVVMNISLTGGFYNDEFLKLSYTSAQPEILQFGAFVLQVDPIPDNMTGAFVGYGPYSKSMVTGTVKISRDRR